MIMADHPKNCGDPKCQLCCDHEPDPYDQDCVKCGLVFEPEDFIDGDLGMRDCVDA